MFVIGHAPHPNWLKTWPVGRIERNCPICGIKFYVRERRLQGGRGVTCSKSCGNKLGGTKRSQSGNGYTSERRIAMSKRQRGENAPNWKGGITPINKRLRRSLEFKIWRHQVFDRDNYTCQICGVKNGNGSNVELHPDHIKQFAYHPELRFEISNGRTLCIICHRKTRTYATNKHVCCL